MRFQALPPNLSVQFDEAAQTFAAFLAAEDVRKRTAGSLYWSRHKGIEYLVQSNASGKVKRLGTRCAELESRHAAFISARQHAKAQYRQQANAMKQQQKLNRIMRVGHLPTPWIRVLNGVRSAGMTDQVMVTGTAATYAYEFAGRVRIINTPGSIEGAAVLAERCSRLQLTVPSPAAALQLLGVIQLAAPTFQIYRDQCYLAIDPQGLEVSVLVDDDTGPRQLQMLLRAPPIIQSVVGQNGEMANMRTLAPRSFALERLIRSGQTERDALERRRDARLAQLVMALTLERMEPVDDRTRPEQFCGTKGQPCSENPMKISA